MSQNTNQPHRSKDYLVTTTIGNIERKVVWNEGHPLHLDHPVGWTLTKVGEKICIYDESMSDVGQMEKNAFFSQELSEDQKMIVQLPPAAKGRAGCSMDLTLVPLVPLKPPYMQQDRQSYANPNVPRQLFLYHGVRYFLLKYRPVGPQMTVAVSGAPGFSYKRTASGYAVTVHRSGLSCKVKGKRTPLAPGIAHEFTQFDFFSAVFINDIYWWRFRAVQTPESMPPIEQEDSEQDLVEQRRFEKTAQVVLSFLACVFLLMTIFKDQLNPPAPISTTVSLQAPKVIPHENIFKELPKPTPVEVVEQPKPTPPPKPEPKKPREVVKALKPQAKKAPIQVAKAPTPVKPRVAPPPAVKAQTPPATGVVVAKKEAPDAAQNAKALNALSFLTTNSKASMKGSFTYSNTKKDFMVAPTLGGGSKDSKVLDKISSDAGDPNIKTTSSRMIASDVKFAGKAGKGLNDVEGKVGSADLHSHGVGGLSAASGLSVSGPGDLSEAQIEKALEKYLSKFQFCYEKALMTDSSLGGNLRLQWTINESGGVSGAKVIQSQLNNESMHSCVLGVLKTVPFPAPKGGSVIAKKTFSFKGSAL
jgi:outer membrane biosynthesis protein TonB